jgi:hypothetical protein
VILFRKSGSSGWTRTSNPPVNSLTWVFGSAVLRGYSSDQVILLPGVRRQIDHRLITAFGFCPAPYSSARESLSRRSFCGPQLSSINAQELVQAATTHCPLDLIASYIASGARSAPFGHATAPSSTRTCRK